MEDKEHILDSGEVYKDPEENNSFFELKTKPNVDWSRVNRVSSVVPGGNPHKTHILISLRKDVLRFVPTFLFTARKTHFVLLAPFVFLAGVYLFREALVHSYGLFILSFGFLLASFLLAYYGYLSLKSFSVQFLFDKKMGIFRKGIIKTEKINLEEIEAVQLIKEYVPASQESNQFAFNSFEINLVLISGDRINVVDHWADRAAQRQARRLSEFLNVPLLMLKDDDTLETK